MTMLTREAIMDARGDSDKLHDILITALEEAKVIPSLSLTVALLALSMTSAMAAGISPKEYSMLVDTMCATAASMIGGKGEITKH
jgi:hypothetical protein